MNTQRAAMLLRTAAEYIAEVDVTPWPTVVYDGAEQTPMGLAMDLVDAAEGEEWQPIAIAPKDGTHVILYRPEIQFIGYYGGPDSGWRINAPGLPAMWPLPTHWMPLPEPPK